jgi:exosortase
MPPANAAGMVELPAVAAEPPRSPVADLLGFSRARRPWQGIAIAALLLAAQLPLLTKFFADLWSRPQYQFFPVALIAAGYVFWDRLRDRPADRLARGSGRVTFPVLALSWLVLAGGLLYLRWMAPVSMLLLLTAAVWWLGGRTLARTALPAGLLLLVMIPPPAHMDETFAIWLQALAVRASSRALDLVALPHLVAGSVIEIPGHRLLIQEACSGINSLMSVITFTLLYGLWQRRRPLTIGVLLIAAAGFVLCANIVRITLGAILIQFCQIDILTGTSHELLGLGLFGVSLALVISFDRFLLLLRPKRGDIPVVESSIAGRRPAPAPSPAGCSRAGKAGWWVAAFAFAGLGALIQARVGHAWPASHLGDAATFSLPAKLAGWEHVQGEGTLNGRPETDGRKSRFWLYRSGSLVAGVAMDYPFVGFHDATICYATSGWNIVDRSQRQPPGRPQDAFVQISMAKSPLMRGALLFGLFDEHGVAPSTTAPASPADGRIKYALALSRHKALTPATYQVQTLAIGYDPFTSEQQASLRALFLAARAELSRQLVTQVGGTP